MSAMLQLTRGGMLQQGVYVVCTFSSSTCRTKTVDRYAMISSVEYVFWIEAKKSTHYYHN
jgi:hypothetical protein